MVAGVLGINKWLFHSMSSVGILPWIDYVRPFYRRDLLLESASARIGAVSLPREFGRLVPPTRPKEDVPPRLFFYRSNVRPFTTSDANWAP